MASQSPRRERSTPELGGVDRGGAGAGGAETRCGSLAAPSDAARQITRPIPHTPAHTDTRFMAAMPETTTVTLCPKCRKPATVKTNQRGQTKMYLCLECRDIF